MSSPVLQVSASAAAAESVDAKEYRRVCESLRVSEARLAVAMEAGELAMWDWNVARDEIYYNERWRECLGVEPEELLARETLADRLLLPPDRPEILERFKAHYYGETPVFECEYALHTGSGALRWFLAHAKVVQRDARGEPLRVIGVLRDITKRKQDVQRAVEVQERWERAVRGTSDGLYDWNLVTGHVWYAARVREILGYDVDAFPDTFRAFEKVVHPEDRELVLAKVRMHLENRGPLDMRCRLVTASGRLIWCRLRGQASRDAAGRPVRLAGSISDISAQVEAEEALLRSQDFYGTILDSLPLYIAYADRAGRLVYANRPFQQYFEAPLAHSRGRPVQRVLGEHRLPDIDRYIERALAGVTTEGQGGFEDAKGRRVELEAFFVPHRDEFGEVQGCFVAARDVTERRQLEAELRQSQKMEAVGRLTGGIAHDFNNLLSVILGNAQLLTRALRESPRLLKQADTTLKAAVRGADLTRRLLAFARQQVLEPRVLMLNDLVAGMHELLRRTLRSDLEIRQHLDPMLWPARVDAGQLENAVLNLVINARDAMPHGGAITIVTRNVVVSAARTAICLASGSAAGDERDVALLDVPPGEYVTLDIADTGVGMSPETQKRVFEPFFTTKDVGKGSGLGLAMVYGFVRQSGGHVRISSAIGRGTVVRLYFPREHAAIEPSSVRPQAEPELPCGSETLLIVEDHAQVRATAVEILSSLGYVTVEASSGEEALERFAQHPDIALVLTDVMLPGALKGPALARKLRERRPELKVLLTSASSEAAMQRGTIEDAIGTIAKPYRVEVLARRVRAALDCPAPGACTRAEG